MDENINQDIKKLALKLVMVTITTKKSSKNYKVVKNDNEDKIIISQTKSGNYLYFNKTANNN